MLFFDDERVGFHGHPALSAVQRCEAFSLHTIITLQCFHILMVDEEEITFPPTYRFERDTREKYVYTKAKATGVSVQLLFSTAKSV